MPQIVAKLWKCSRCKHEWKSRVAIPLRCAGCKTPYWNRARQKEIKNVDDKREG